MQCVEIDQATTCFPDIINKTIEGDEIVITKSGKPIVKFVAIGGPSAATIPLLRT